MIEIGQTPNDFMGNTIFKEWIYEIDYTTILAGIIMMDPPDNIEQVKEEIRKCG